MVKYALFLVFSFIIFSSYCQDVSLYQQFNGRYDYTAIGNTFNTIENGPGTNCTITTISSADLNLSTDQTIIAAYLYWAGSGSGDFDITLNGIDITAERTFNDSLDEERIFFVAFADVTEIITSLGNQTYTVENLDLTDVITPYCPTGTNFAGWAITVIYQDNNLPLNQINVYDGLQSVPTDLTIVLDNLNVFDNQGAKIGFIAWEGDSALAVNEQLTINGNVIGNLPLNPPNNAFNGTNSFTGETTLYNMDIDVYNIQNNIDIGDTTATIQLTSGQDFVMINNIITVLNSQLPDATVEIDNVILECNSRTIEMVFTVSNTNSTATLPANTPIAIYANEELVAQTSITMPLDIGASENISFTLEIPSGFPDIFTLLVSVDDDGTGNGIVAETNEENNSSEAIPVELLIIPPISSLPNLLLCDEGFNRAVFDLTEILDYIDSDSVDVSFYLNDEDAHSGINSILTPEIYTNISSPQTLFIRVETGICYEIFSFIIDVENCPPWIPQGFSPNGDGLNDEFVILGLRDIFEDFQLKIYNRLGILIYQGNNSIPNWNGRSNQGLNNKGKVLPVGTYFYILYLNDPNYTNLTGWVYLNK